MVDPIYFTNFNHNLVELEEKIIFSVLVAGKNALTTAKCCENFLREVHEKTSVEWMQPFICLRNFKSTEIAKILHSNGIGCNNYKGRALYELVNSNIDLRECSVEELEKIFFIGPKTSRMFVLHTRPDVEHGVLDVHILKYLRDRGVENVPRGTPTGKHYIRLEKDFIRFAKAAGMSAADFDLYLWRKYSGREVA